MENTILDNLNEEQKAPAKQVDCAVLVTACAGSGKTRMLTHRIAYMVKELEINPNNILAITFTNKAANEMKERLEKILGESAKDIWAGTFHSICVRILRRYIDRLGYDKSFTIYDTDDQKRLISACIKEKNLDEKTFQPRSVLGEISRSKDRLEGYSAYAKNCGQDFRK